MALDFPGGPVVKNPLANLGDVGSIPGLGWFHMPQATGPQRHGYWSCVLQLLEPPLKSTPPLHNWWKSESSNEDPAKPKIYKNLKNTRWLHFFLTIYFYFIYHLSHRGFPGGSDGKESACNAGDSGSSPGLGRSPGEGHGNPLQYSCLENSTDRGAWWATVHGVAKNKTWSSDQHFHIFNLAVLQLPCNTWASLQLYAQALEHKGQ